MQQEGGKNEDEKENMARGLFVLLCLFILMLPAKASSIPAERQKPLLVDDAGLLTTEESTALLEKLEEISQRQQNEVAIVTVNSLDGKTAQAYADDYDDYKWYMVTGKTMTVFCS